MGKLDRSERTTFLLREPQKDAYEDLACSYSAYAVSECLQSLEGASQFENYRLTEILSWLRSMQGPRSLEPTRWCTRRSIQKSHYSRSEQIAKALLAGLP